jgi:nucleoside-diphosphate-sugar epimerase
MKTDMKIILPGGAGLVGQNLIARLKARGYTHLVVLDKHKYNLEILRRLHPNIIAEYADLAESGEWEKHFEDAQVVVMLQAQIGGSTLESFIRNNITSTKIILEVIKRYRIPHLVHISSSVVESVANDDYSNTKREQENIVMQSQVPNVVLRPTLMFGWFDRKHLGWLSRFMHKVPVFPIPGNGRDIRQPMYVGDFCNIVISCIENRTSGQVFNISGLEKINYIDIIRSIKLATKSKTVLLNIPYRLFYSLLKIWAVFDTNPPFTADQLSALTAKDEFEIIDWPHIFGVTPTPFDLAIRQTFTHPVYSKIILGF